MLLGRFAVKVIMSFLFFTAIVSCGSAELKVDPLDSTVTTSDLPPDEEEKKPKGLQLKWYLGVEHGDSYYELEMKDNSHIEPREAVSLEGEVIIRIKANTPIEQDFNVLVELGLSGSVLTIPSPNYHFDLNSSKTEIEIHLSSARLLDTAPYRVSLINLRPLGGESGDYSQSFFVLLGDVDANGEVDGSDRDLVLDHESGPGGFADSVNPQEIRADVHNVGHYGGVVDSHDAQFVENHFGRVLGVPVF